MRESRLSINNANLDYELWLMSEWVRWRVEMTVNDLRWRVVLSPSSSRRVNKNIRGRRSVTRPKQQKMARRGCKSHFEFSCAKNGIVEFSCASRCLNLAQERWWWWWRLLVSMRRRRRRRQIRKTEDCKKRTTVVVAPFAKAPINGNFLSLPFVPYCTSCCCCCRWFPE